METPYKPDPLELIDVEEELRKKHTLLIDQIEVKVKYLILTFEKIVVK